MRFIPLFAPRLFTVLHMSTHVIAESISISSSKPIQIGLTGSIGMGKSTLTKHFRQLGFPVFDADSAVHDLYGKHGEAVPLIQSLVPEAIIEYSVCRKTLSKYILENNQLLKQLESIVHPLVKEKREKFYQEACDRGHFLVVYDIPLLLENPSNHQVDYVVVASASAEIQIERVLSRPGMTLEKFQSIHSKQIPDIEKRARADYVVDTGFPEYSSARAQVASVIESIVDKHPEHWEQFITREKSSIFQGNTELLKKTDDFILSDHVDLVVFDLDDTLVPTESALRAAQFAFLSFIAEVAPKTHVDLQQGKIGGVMKQLAADFPLLKHDLTAIRRNALVQMLKDNNEHTDVIVDRAIDLFVENRNLVDHFLYTDTIPCLEWLRSQGVRVAVVTNGTANLTQSPVLNSYLELSLCAGETGAMKPSPVPFIAVLQRLSVCASRTVFVGDSYENDVVGSKRCGMHSVFLVRPIDESLPVNTTGTTTTSTDTTSTSDKDNAQVMDLTSPPISSFAYRPVRNPSADQTLADITVSSLDPSHFADKLRAHFTKK